MLLGITNTIEWFSETGFSHWILYYKGAEKGGQPVFRFDDDAEQSQADAIDRLRKALNMLDRGSYSLTALPKQGANGRGAQKIHFEILVAGSGIGMGNMPMPAPVVQGLTAEDVNKQIAAAKLQWDLEAELKQLRAENALLKKQVSENEKSEPVTALIGHIGPYLPELLGITKPGIAGLPMPVQMQRAADVPDTANGGSIAADPAAVELTDEQHARLSHVISVFVTVSPNEWLPLLERIAAKVQAQPQILDTIKMFI